MSAQIAPPTSEPAAPAAMAAGRLTTPRSVSIWLRPFSWHAPQAGWPFTMPLQLVHVGFPQRAHGFCDALSAIPQQVAAGAGTGADARCDGRTVGADLRVGVVMSGAPGASRGVAKCGAAIRSIGVAAGPTQGPARASRPGQNRRPLAGFKR